MIVNAGRLYSGSGNAGFQAAVINVVVLVTTWRGFDTRSATTGIDVSIAEAKPYIVIEVLRNWSVVGRPRPRISRALS